MFFQYLVLQGNAVHVSSYKVVSSFARVSLVAWHSLMSPAQQT